MIVTTKIDWFIISDTFNQPLQARNSLEPQIEKNPET